MSIDISNLNFKINKNVHNVIKIIAKIEKKFLFILIGEIILEYIKKYEKSKDLKLL